MRVMIAKKDETMMNEMRADRSHRAWVSALYIVSSADVDHGSQSRFPPCVVPKQRGASNFAVQREHPNPLKSVASRHPVVSRHASPVRQTVR